MSESKPIVVEINNEINAQLKTEAVKRALLATTFKKFDDKLMRQALTEGMLRGFTFKNFLQKDIYAIKYGDGYSLMTSIDYARKIGMRNSVVGSCKPEYETEKDDEGNKKIISCTVTVKRKIDEYVGEYTATVYFDEYYKPGKTWNGKYTPSLWDTKPRTMIAKVAEMHALRKACPEDLSQIYVEEEFEKEAYVVEEKENRYREANDTSESLKMGNLEQKDADKNSKKAKEDKAKNDAAESEQGSD